MILRSAAASPFARKIRIAAHLLGLSASISVVDADTMSPTDSIRHENPLGKIPTLILDDGTTLYDSRVILAYLDALAGGGRLIPSEIGARFAVLRLEALADGLCDAALLQVYEGRWRDPAQHDARWLAHQADKIARGLAALEEAPPAVAVDAGTLALACALGYLDLRFGGRWRAEHPKLDAWLDAFAAEVPAFAATRPPGA
jgi:glutathione S-transferase